MAVRSSQCQNKALRSTQRGGGVTLSTFHNASCIKILHITPSFNIDRLCKTASVLLFLVIFVIQIKILVIPIFNSFCNVYWQFAQSQTFCRT